MSLTESNQMLCHCLKEEEDEEEEEERGVGFTMAGVAVWGGARETERITHRHTK